MLVDDWGFRRCSTRFLGREAEFLLVKIDGAVKWNLEALGRLVAGHWERLLHQTALTGC